MIARSGKGGPLPCNGMTTAQIIKKSGSCSEYLVQRNVTWLCSRRIATNTSTNFMKPLFGLFASEYHDSVVKELA